MTEIQETEAEAAIALYTHATRGQAAERFIFSIDWPLLKQQYHWLCEQRDVCQELADTQLEPEFKYRNQDYADQAEGLINFLDNFKDLAVGFFDVTEEQAFAFTEDKNNGATGISA